MKAAHVLRLIGIAAVAAAILATTTALPLGSAGSPVDVSYAGPRALQGDIRLRADATARGARIVAVTFLLDRSVIGSDATPPYALDVSTRLLPPGKHILRVVAVDSRGRRAAGRPIPVRIRPGGARIVSASSTRGLSRALAALRAGGVTVRLAPGRYVLSDVTLGSGSRLVGSGPRTVVIPPPGVAYFALLIARGSGIRVSDLAIDGGGPGEGKGIGVAVWEGSNDVRLQRLRFTRVRGDGVNAWGHHADISLQDSTLDGGGTAHSGVRVFGSDASRDVSVMRTAIRGFRGYGIVFAQKEYGRPAAALHALALDNTISDISDPQHAICSVEPLTPGCGTSEAGIESGGVSAAIVGNTIRRTRWDGIETVGSSTGVSITANDIAQTRVGIYLERSTVGSRIEGNRISSVRTGVNIEWLHEGAGSRGNAIVRNEIVGARHAPIFVDVGADENRIERNLLVGGARPAIVIQGSSRNLVRLNRACRASGAVVAQRAGLWEDGREAQPTENRIARNVSVRSCSSSRRP
jgi:hypothetical protein